MGDASSPKHKQICLKFVQKALKGHYDVSIFKSFSEEHAPGPPWSRFCYLNCLKLTLRKKTTHEKVTKFGASSMIKKFVNTPLT